jgi:2-polyprenyl-3-methyl-5-hydroxy-6-metoxy-1,4-benzoquinol methylase
MSGDSRGSASAVDRAAIAPARKPVWTRFIDANKRFCRQFLQPRLYPVTHMTALDVWYSRRVSRVAPGASLLEFGCGRSMRLTQMLGDRFSVKCATDIEDVPDAEVPDGVTFRQCTADRIPFDNEQFDVVVIRSVLEHVDDPDVTFRELARVTSHGGQVLINVPNKWDYVSVLAMLSGRFKSSILKHVVRTEWEDFPVRYRCNTRRALTRVANAAGFEIEQFLPLPSQPGYLSFFVPLYVLGAIYQFVIGICGLDMLQPAFIAVLRKRGPARELLA